MEEAVEVEVTNRSNEEWGRRGLAYRGQWESDQFWVRVQFSTHARLVARTSLMKVD